MGWRENTARCFRLRAKRFGVTAAFERDYSSERSGAAGEAAA